MDIKFSLPSTATPVEVRDAIKAEVERRILRIDPSTKAFNKHYHRGEATALASIVWFLERLEFREPSKEPSHDRQD